MNSVAVAAAGALPLVAAPVASADNGVCESMDANASFEIEVCMQVRGSVSDVVFQVRKPGQTFLQGGKVTFRAYSDADDREAVGWSTPVSISLNDASSELSAWGCVGGLGGPFAPDTNPCVSWKDDGEMYFKAWRYDRRGNKLDSLESSSIGVEAAVK